MAKEFTWKGKTEEQLKNLDMKEFMVLTTARQRRSLQRGFTEVQKSFMERIAAGENNVKTHCRDMIIVPQMIGKTIRVYNGKEFLPVIIIGAMIGHYLGEFSPTRKGVAHSAAGIGATRSSKAISAR